MGMGRWVPLLVALEIPGLWEGASLRFRWDLWPRPLIDGPGIPIAATISTGVADVTGIRESALTVPLLPVVSQRQFTRPDSDADTVWPARLISRVKQWWPVIADAMRR